MESLCEDLRNEVESYLSPYWDPKEKEYNFTNNVPDDDIADDFNEFCNKLDGIHDYEYYDEITSNLMNKLVKYHALNEAFESLERITSKYITAQPLDVQAKWNKANYHERLYDIIEGEV